MSPIETKTSSACTCREPRPVEVASRKGAARTHCTRCGKPMPLRFA